jgi:hypothetical protein
MDIYIPISVIDSAEFSGAEPLDRATWLCLMRYCCQQENGGRILECVSWGDRRWQQCCKVTLAEVRRECDLWYWEEFNLVVAFYSMEKQETHQRLSAKGKEAALMRWERDRGLGGANVEKSEPQPKKMPAAVPQASKLDAKGNAVLEWQKGINGTNGIEWRAALASLTATLKDSLSSSWADRNPTLMPSMIERFTNGGQTIKEVLEFWQVMWNLSGKPLNGEWQDVTKGQKAVDVFLTIAHAPEGSVKLPSKYRIARKKYEAMEAA